MFHICIVTRSTPATNPRLLKEVAALLNAGYEVSVVSGKHVGWSQAYDASWREPRLKTQVALNYGPGTPLLKRLQQLSRRLSSRAIMQTVPKSPVRLAEYATHDVTPDLTAAAMKIPADLYIAHYVAALPAAAKAAKHHNAVYAYDAEDFHLGDTPDAPTYTLEKSMIRAIEGRYLPDAAYISAASPMIAEALSKAYSIPKPHVILNTFPRAQAPLAPTLQGISEFRPSLYWFSQTIGPDRGLECAVKAIGLSRARPHLFLRGIVSETNQANLEALAKQAGAKGCVHFLPPAAPQDMERLAAEYDLGLASETDVTHNRKICLTNKLFSFLLAGLPPLMSATPAQAAFAQEAGLEDLVYPIDDAEALSRLIDRYLLDAQRLTQTRQRIWRLGQERYNWECEAITLCRIVSTALNSASPLSKAA